MMKLIELLDKAQQPELQVLKERDKYHARDVRQAELINKAVNFCIAKATELMQEERDVAIGLLEWMNKVTYDTPMRLETDNDDIVDQYFTETYGGGYE